jgi:WD40 repeat protein
VSRQLSRWLRAGSLCVLLVGLSACNRAQPTSAEPQPVAKIDAPPTPAPAPVPQVQPVTPPPSHPTVPDKPAPQKEPAKPEAPPTGPKNPEPKQLPEPKQQPQSEPKPKQEPTPAPVSEPNFGGALLDLSRDGKTLVSSDYFTIRFWSVPDAKVVRTITAPKDYGFTSLALSHDGKFLVTGTSRGATDNPVVVWDADKGQILKSMNPMTDTILVKSIPAQGRFIGPGMSWTPAKLPTETAESVAFSPDGKTVVTAGDGMLHVYNPATGQNTAALGYNTPVPNLPALPGLGVWSAAYTPDGKHVITGGADGYLRWWDTATGKNVANHTPGIAGVSLKVVISPDGKTLASWTPGGKEFRLWDTARGTNTQTFTTDKPVYSVAFSSDGKTVASGGGWWNAQQNTAELKLWDIASGKTLTTLPAEKHEMIYCVVFAPDGKTLISQSTKDIKLWDVTTKKCVKTFGR